MIDTHCHLNFRAFKDDAAAAVERARARGVDAIINVGSQWDTSERAAAMARESSGLYAAVGLHPIHLYAQEVDEEESHFVTRAEVFEPERYRALVRGNAKVVAVGECGLDYYRFPPGVAPGEVRERQAELFRQQVDLATELDLPLIIHCREAYDDLFALLKDAVGAGKLSRGGVNHCFLGTAQHARKFLELGFHLSFTGIITFRNVNPGLLEVVREVPLTRILTETDAPYLAPHPHRGTRNEPAYVTEVVKKIAELRAVSHEEVDGVTTENARRLFNIRT